MFGLCLATEVNSHLHYSECSIVQIKEEAASTGSQDEKKSREMWRLAGTVCRPPTVPVIQSLTSKVHTTSLLLPSFPCAEVAPKDDLPSKPEESSPVPSEGDDDDAEESAFVIGGR